MMRAQNTTAAILLLAMALGGCATYPTPELVRLSQERAADHLQVPVIIIPGMLGSRLVDRETGVEAWPGSSRKLLTSGYQELALRIDPDTLEPLDDGLIPGGIFDSAVGRDFYGRIIKALKRTGGYRQAQPGQHATHGDALMYTFTYDWRQDMVAAVRKLDELIEQIRHDYDDPTLRVDIIGHSMGGLIVRYYERYGTRDVLDGNFFPITGDGARKLRRVVLLGTPNQGVASAIYYFRNGYRVALSRLPTEGVATMPGLYQFFPNPRVTWITDTQGTPLNLDLFDVGTWRDFGWSVFDHNVQRKMAAQPGVWPAQDVFERYFEKRLERAQRFAWALSVPIGDVVLIQPLLFGSDCVPTPARLVLEVVDGESVARLRPEEIQHPVPGIDYDKLMYAPGDGKVTKSSLLGRQEPDVTTQRNEYAGAEFDHSFLFCAAHDVLSGNVHLINNLLHYLLSVDRPAPAAH